jgi:hypothetical protein
VTLSANIHPRLLLSELQTPNPEPLLFALAFTDLWMLGWLAAAAAPVIIHLWNKRKYREIQWAAMEYLLAAIRKNSRRIRIEQWLLLAIRTSIVVLVVLAVAGPYVQNFAGVFTAGQPTHKVLVIDGSYSMDYKSGDKTRFERAKQLAAQLVEQSSASDGFSLVLMSAPPREIISSPILTPAAVVEEIENVKPRHGGADLPATLAQVEEIIQRAKTEQPNLAHTQVYFLTDLASNAWNAATETDATRLAESAGMFIIDIGQSQTENVTVNLLRCEEPYATANRPLHFEAQITNYGRKPRQQSVGWWIDGERVREETVELAAGGQQTVGLEWRFDRPGSFVVEVRTSGDALEIDNHRWLAIDVRPQVNVLVVNGDGSQQAVRQLVSALNPESDPMRSPIRVEVGPESALGERDLNRYDAVFLSNVGQFTPAEAQMLSHYVETGGRLVMFLGDRVQPERYNYELGGGRKDGVRLLPAQLDQPSEAGQFSLDPLGYRHVIVAEFAGNERAGLLTTPIAKYFRLKSLTDKATRANTVLAIRETGEPLVVEESIGKGRVVLVALPASLATIDSVTKSPWTMMSAWHSFLPLVQEMLAFVLAGQLQQRNLEVGDVLSGETAASESVAITLPSAGGNADTARATSDKDGRWHFDDTWQSGVYRAKPVAHNSTQTFAVNIDTGNATNGESSLQKSDPDDLPREFTVLNPGQSANQQASIDLRVSTGIQSWFLYAVLLLLLVETGYAGWLGKRSG